MYFNPQFPVFQYAYPVNIRVCFDEEQEFINYSTKLYTLVLHPILSKKLKFSEGTIFLFDYHFH